MAIPAGRYYIVCSAVSHYYGTLTLQYKGEDVPVTLVQFGSERGTLWNVTTNPDGTQIISPDSHSNDQAVSVDGVVRTISSAKESWVIKMTDGACTISNGTSDRWEVQLIKGDDGQETPVPGGQVTVGSSSTSVTYLWWCLPVPTC